MKKEEIPDDAIIEHPPSSIPEIREPPMKKAKKDEVQEYDSDSIF